MVGFKVSSDASKIANDVGSFSDAVYVVMTAGRFDLIAEVVCRDRATFVDLTNEFRSMPGVSAVELLPYLGIVKQTNDWGVG